MARLRLGGAQAGAAAAAAREVSSAASFDAAKARRVSRDFEAIFLRQLVREMAATTMDGPFGQSSAGQMYRGMFNDALADVMAESGGVGLADAVYSDLESRARGTRRSEPPTVAEEPQARPLPDPEVPIVRTPDGRPLRVRSLAEVEAQVWRPLASTPQTRPLQEREE